MNFECTFSCLNCGNNFSGISGILSIEKYHDFSEDRSAVSKCLINCGDSTLRFCMENQIKLQRLSFILLTSLAPHNVSGLAGILLSLSDLGVGTVTIAGPSGLKNLIALMHPFVNRRY